jgi:S-disulfanyl-L-cysteine oxidoreductase SoxD
MALRHLFIALVAAPLMLGASPSTTSTLKGVYTEDQAQAGAQLYAARCAMCHGRLLEGTFETPGLQNRFIVNWSKAPLGELYDYLGRAMPQFAPGSLKPDENAKIVAYLLKANAQPAGAQPLPADSIALRRIMLEPVSARTAGKAK